MNTLIVAEQLRRRVPGGIGTYIEGLIQGLQKESDQYLGLWASKSPGSPDPLETFGLPVYTSRWPSKVLTRMWDQGVSSQPPEWDVVHATSTLVPARKDNVLTATVHDLGWREFPDAYPKRGRDWHEASLQRTLKRAQIIITPSQQTANALLDAGVDRDRIQAVSLGCDHLPAPDTRGALEKLNKAGVHGEFILAVGTLEPRKNLERLIAGFLKAREDFENEEIALVIVGPDGWGDKLKPSAHVHIISSATLPEITALYQRCTAFVSVPLLEGFGLPVLEAMSQGAPVVSSAVPSAGDATYRVDPMNPAAIAEGIVRVVEDKVLRNSLIDKGEARAKSFTWAKTARAHIDVWDRLL